MTPKSKCLLALAALGLAACASTPAHPPTPPAVAPHLVARVPADAAWVVVVPEATRAGLDAALRPVVAGARAAEPLLVELVSKLVTDGAVPDTAAGLELWARGLPYVLGLLDPGRLEALGVGFPTPLVLHGAPLWPVVRLRLADPGRTRDALAALLDGTSLATREDLAPGVATWLVTLRELRLRVGVSDDQLVVALWPVDDDGISAAAFLGAAGTDPAGTAAALEDALRKTGGRRDLAAAWVRTDRLVRGGLVDYFTTSEADDASTPEERATCRRELEALAAGLPRLVMGYRSWTPTASRFSAALDLQDPPLATAIAAVGDGGVELAAEPYAAPDVAFSVSLDVGKLGDLLGLLARRMAEAGYTCEQVREIGDWLTGTAMKVGLSGRLVLGGFHALHVRVAVPEGADPMDVFDGRMVAVVVHDAPEELAEMLARFAGMQLDLPPDGETRAVAGTDGLVIGRRGRLTGLGYGADAAERLARALDGGVGAAAPLMRYAVNGGFGDDHLGLLERVDEALAAAKSFPDGARYEGEVARVGDAVIDAEQAYARARALEESGHPMTPDTLLDTAISQLIDRELALAALRKLREPSLAERRPFDDARALVRRRLERRGRLRFSPRQIKARYDEMTRGMSDMPPLDDALAASVAEQLAIDRVQVETEKLLAAQRKRTPVLDEREAALAQVTAHWQSVWALRDAIAEKLKSAQPDERVESTLHVRDGLLEVLGETLPRPAPATEAPPTPEAPSQDVPSQDVPSQDVPSQDVPAQEAPSQETPR